MAMPVNQVVRKLWNLKIRDGTDENAEEVDALIKRVLIRGNTDWGIMYRNPSVKTGFHARKSVPIPYM